jgi:hypothetical protein
LQGGLDARFVVFSDHLLESRVSVVGSQKSHLAEVRCLRLIEHEEQEIRDPYSFWLCKQRLWG